MAGETELNPVRWNKVVLGGNIIPGDTLILLDGTYPGASLQIEGTAELPIIIRPKNPGMVTIDWDISIPGPYVHFYDINFTDSRVDRRILTNGVYSPVGTNNFYGCIFSDHHSSGLNWFGSGAGEICECIFLNNGDIFPNGSWHGHGLYTHNDGGGARLIARNLFHYSMGKYGLHIYSDTNHLKDYTVEDNISCGHPTHTGGPGSLTNYVYQRNIQYGAYNQQGRYTFGGQNSGGSINDNVFFDLTAYSVNADSTYAWLDLIESGNTVYGGEPAARAGYTLTEQPAIWSRVIPFTKSARWVASVAIFNRDSAETVSVDFSGIANGSYKLRNSQNPAETWAFSYSGNAVDVPMTVWTMAQVNGAGTPATSFPIFGSFVVEK